MLTTKLLHRFAAAAAEKRNAKNTCHSDWLDWLDWMLFPALRLRQKRATKPGGRQQPASGVEGSQPALAKPESKNPVVANRAQCANPSAAEGPSSRMQNGVCKRMDGTLGREKKEKRS
jgi:hypothetical protein